MNNYIGQYSWRLDWYRSVSIACGLSSVVIAGVTLWMAYAYPWRKAS